MVQQDFHRVAFPFGNPSIKCSKAICNVRAHVSRERPSKLSRTSSRLRPRSRWSNKLFTGKRVPAKQGVPHIRSGSMEIMSERGSDDSTSSVSSEFAGVSGAGFLMVCGISFSLTVSIPDRRTGRCCLPLLSLIIPEGDIIHNSVYLIRGKFSQIKMVIPLKKRASNRIDHRLLDPSPVSLIVVHGEKNRQTGKGTS